MHIGVAGPCSLGPLAEWLRERDLADLPATHSFPQIGELAANYLRRGHRVSVYTSSFALHDTLRLDCGPLKLRIVPRRVSRRSLALSLFAEERKRLHAEMQCDKPDVIHAHWLYEYAWSALAYSRSAVVTAHDGPVSVLRYYHHPDWLFREGMSLRTLREAEIVTAVNPELAAELAPFRGRSRTPVVIVPNGIDRPQELLQPGADPADGAITWVSIASGVDHRKNTSTALRAFAIARQHLGDESRLLMVGAGHEADGPAQRWCEAKGISTTGVSFMGVLPHDEVLEILERSSVGLLHTSRWEACSVAILEAQARGVPVIGGEASGGVPSSLAGGAAGRLVDVRSPEAVADALRELSRESSVYNSLAEAGVRNIRERYTLDSVCDSYLGLLEANAGVRK